MKKKSYLLFVGFFVMTVLFLSTALAQTINEPVKSGERNLQVNSFTRESIAATASPGIQSGNRSENVLPVNGNESACCAITRITGRHSMTLIPEELAHVFEQTRSSVHVQYPKAPTDDASILLVATTQVGGSVQQALSELGYTYDYTYSENDWTGINFSPYDVVIIAMDGGLVGAPSLLKIRTDVIDAGKRVIFIGGTCYQPFAAGVNQYLVQNNVNNYCWSISAQLQFTVTQPAHDLAQGLASPWNFVNNSAGYYALRATDPDIDVVAQNGDNWPILFYKGDNWPNVKGNNAKGGGDLIWFTNTANEGYWSNPSDFALLKQMISNSILYTSSCFETVLLISTTAVDNSVKKALNELDYTYSDIFSSDWTGIDFSPYDVVIIAMDGGSVGESSLLKIRTDVIDAGKRVIFIGGTCNQPFATGVNQYLVQNNVNNYCWSISPTPQLTVVQPGHWLAEDVPSPYNFANNSTGYYALRANDPDIDIVAMNGDNWPNLFYKNGNWPGSKDNKAKAVGDLIWFTNTAADNYWSNPSDFTLLKQVIENCLSCASPCNNPSDGGAIAASQTICTNTSPDPLIQTVAPGGNPVGTLEYKWQSAANGTDFYDIQPPAASEGYSPPALAATTWYKRLVKVDCETEWVESNVVEVTVEEELSLSCPEPITVNNDEGACGASVEFAATAVGTPTPTLTYTLDGTEISSPHLFDVGTHTVVVTAENDCGLLDCSFTVTVNDNEPPTITCPEDITVNNDEGLCGAVVSYDNPVASDNCGGSVTNPLIYFTATFEGKIYSANADGSGTPTLLYDPDDGIPIFGPVGIEADLGSGTLYWGGGNHGNIYKAPEDGMGTVTTIPSTNGCCEHHDLEIDLINGKIYFTLAGIGLAVANLDGSGTATSLTTTYATSMALDRTNNRIYFAYPDFYGINVINTNGTGEVSNFIAAGDQVRGITIDEAAGRLYWADMGEGKIYTAKADGTETPYILYDDGATGNVYGIDYDAANGLLYWTVFNNSSGIDYIIVAPANGSGTPTVLYTGSYGSIRGIASGRNIHGMTGGAGTPVSVVCTPPSGSLFPVGTTTVECVATDATGNNASCTFTVTVNDNELPTITCPADITVSNDEDVCGAVVSYDLPDIDDNCVLIMGTSIPGYTYIGELDGHSYFRSDFSKNWSSANAAATALGGHLVTISSAEENALVSGYHTWCWMGLTDELVEGTWVWVTGEPVVYTSWAPGEPNNLNNEDYATTDWGAYLWNDLPDTSTGHFIVEFDTPIPNQTSGLPSGSVFPIGTTTNTFYVTDGSGNTASCSFTVTVNDTQPPAITCIPDLTVNTDPDACGALVSTGYLYTSEAWDLYLRQVDPDTYTTINTIPIIPSSGEYYNTTGMAQDPTNGDVYVILGHNWGGDNNRALAKLDLTTGDAAIVGNTGRYFSSIAFADNGDLYGVTGNGGQGNFGPINSLYFINKADGSSTYLVGLGSSGNHALAFNSDDGMMYHWSWPVMEKIDLTSLTVTDIPVSGSTMDDYPTAATYIGSGNFLLVHWDRVHIVNPSGYGAFAGYLYHYVKGLINDRTRYGITASDNCSVTLGQIAGLPSESFFPVGTTTNTFLATDASGNTASCSFTVTVIDNQAPDVLTKNLSIQLDMSGNATIVPGDIDNGSTDNCAIDTYELDKNTFTPADKGNNTVTLTVTDIHGNEASNTANVFVANLPAPWKECDTHVSANGTGDYDFDPTNPTFNLTATGKSTTLMDVHHFIYQEMCGNQVTVIACLAEVENGGWAGVMMRESCSPGAKAILFKTRLYNPNVIIGYRTTDNKAMRNLSQVAQLIRWMKIQRNGSNFKVFTSYNGTTWQQRYSGTISMGSCIQAGIFTESVLATRTSVAWFDHVKVEYGLKSGDEIVIDDNNMQSEKPEFELYPNPADDLVTISIPENESEVSYSITDMDGRVIEQSGFTGNEAVLDVSSFKPGLYVIRMEIGGEVVTKRLVVM